MSMRNKTPPVPRSQISTLFGGMAVVGVGLGAWWYAIVRRQARKDERGAYPPYEHRLLQAQAYAGNPARPSMSPQSRNTSAAHQRAAAGVLTTDPKSKVDASSVPSTTQ